MLRYFDSIKDKIKQFNKTLCIGMCCSLVPTYLSEIAPSILRGQIGVLAQLFITLGILVAQLLGFRQILGNYYTLWIEGSVHFRF